ncbi:MAG: hypothetical protein IRY85_17015 [Micromonosporaceae bacterium]|nr:hypothetical protein [Micromonosporaceae bacterium]
MGGRVRRGPGRGDLRNPEGRDVPEFLLHIDGDQAWWRWSDEPFDEDP